MKNVTVLIPEEEARRHQDWTACEAFRFEPLPDGRFRFRVKGIPDVEDRECDWCRGKGHVVQYGPDNQTANVPCVRCKGTGRLDA